MSNVHLAACCYDWDGFWARPKQLIPRDPRYRWISWGFLTGRRFGKTRAIAEWITEEVLAGRVIRLGFCAQNEDKTYQVQAQEGLIACSPPWFKAEWVNEVVRWPNGVEAWPFTPEKPNNFRGPGFSHFWATELQSWPVDGRGEKAWSNAKIMTTLGPARRLWDCTPKAAHPILRELVQDNRERPEKHVIVNGDIWENLANLSDDVVEELTIKLKGTREGEEELEGKYYDEVETALWKETWIKNRRAASSSYARRILTIDPAVTSGEYSDETGIVEHGLTREGRVDTIDDDLSTRDEPTVWVPTVLDRYLEGKCDLIVAELDRGGNLVVEVIRLHAKERAIKMNIVAPDDRTPLKHNPRVVNVRAINTQQKSKAARAKPVSTATQKGFVNHPRALPILESQLTTWDPTNPKKSPNRLDAHVHGVRELLDLNSEEERRDPKQAFVGLDKAAEQLMRPTQIGSIQNLLGGRSDDSI